MCLAFLTKLHLGFAAVRSCTVVWLQACAWLPAPAEGEFPRCKWTRSNSYCKVPLSPACAGFFPWTPSRTLAVTNSCCCSFSLSVWSNHSLAGLKRSRLCIIFWHFLKTKCSIYYFFHLPWQCTSHKQFGKWMESLSCCVALCITSAELLFWNF